MAHNFDFCTHYQSDYFEEIGRMVADDNSKTKLKKSQKGKSSLLGVVISDSYGMASIIHCTKISWYVKDNKIDDIEYVLAIYKRTVVGVLKFNKKFEVEQNTNRKILSIQMADIDVQRKYLGAKVLAKPRTTVYLETI